MITSHAKLYQDPLNVGDESPVIALWLQNLCLVIQVLESKVYNWASLCDKIAP